MSTLPAHIWDSQFRMLRVAFACATLHLCTLPADDRKSFCPLPFSLFCMKSLGYGCILQTPKRQLRRFCLSYLLDLNFTCASKQYVRFLMLMFSCFAESPGQTPSYRNSLRLLRHRVIAWLATAVNYLQ